jgi:TRAP-type C4-dicarboxylate transport system permease small subunit
MRFATLISGLVAAIRGLTACLLLIAVALNFANIIGRYLLSAPIAWAEEVMLFLLVAVVFLGSSVVSWEGRQIRMDVVLHMLPVPLRRGLEVIADLATITVSIAIIWFAWPVISMLVEFDQRSQAADFPLFVPQGLIPVGLGLTALLTAIRLARELGGRDVAPDSHDSSHAA